MVISMALYVIPKKKGRMEGDIYNNTVVSHIYTYDRAQNILNFVQPLQKLIL